MDQLHRHILGLSFIYVVCFLSLTGLCKVSPWINCIDIYWDSRFFSDSFQQQVSQLQYIVPDLNLIRF